MSDSSVPVNAAPTAEPERRTEGRRITGVWMVGQPDQKGWQQQVHLTVAYYKSHGYTANLCVRHERTTSLGTEIRFDVGSATTRVDHQPGTRFHAATLTRVYDTALATVRRRYENNDDRIVAFFTLAARDLTPLGTDTGLDETTGAE